MSAVTASHKIVVKIVSHEKSVVLQTLFIKPKPT